MLTLTVLEHVESTEQEIDIKLSNSIESSMREMEMREAIKLNVMFFNVEESCAENEEKRMREDTELPTNLQQDIQTSVALTNIHRIGKYEVGKTRSLRASVRDTTELRKLLKYAKKLRDSDSFSNVFIGQRYDPVTKESMEKSYKRETGETGDVIV